MAVIFVKMRNDEGELYRSYIDYWRLVDLSGFDKCELSEVDRDSDNTYIFSPVNGNVIAFLSGPHKARFVTWQLERPNKEDATCRAYGIKSIGEMWVSDRALAEACECKYVPMGGHPDLGGEKKEPIFQFVHICYAYGERKHKIDGLSYAAPATFEGNRHLDKSKYGLCLHQDEFPTIEPLRYTLFSCWKLPIIAEQSDDFYPYEVQVFGEDIDEEKGKEQAERNYIKMTQELTFRKCVEKALNS